MHDSPTQNLTFEQALAELERIVRELEEGQSGLEDALGSYERGVALLKQCYGLLSLAEQRILVLSGVDAEGKAVLMPFDHTATVDADKPDAKRRRKPIDNPDNPRRGKEEG